MATVVRPQGVDWYLNATVYPGAPSGFFKGQIEIYVDEADVPEIVVPVEGEIIK